MFLKKYLHIFILFTIFVLALFLRFYNLSSLPFSFHHDELINTYIGRYILLHGQDLRGNAWPIFYFDKFGDFPPVFPMYFSGFATFLFGVNEFASRFPSAFFGSLTIFAVYLLAKNFFKNNFIALMSSLFFAILPWSIVMSRASAEVVLGVASFTVGILFLIKGMDLKKNYSLNIFFSLIFFGLSYLLYPSFRLLSPLVIIPFFYLFKIKKQRLIILFFLCTLSLATIAIGSTNWGKARFLQTSLFADKDVVLRIESLQRDEGQNKIFQARLFNNKIIGYSREFARQYLSYFSPGFLFSTNGLPYNYNVPDNGLAYFTYILFLIGLLLGKKQEESKFYYFTLYLLFIAPIPAALTTDFVPNVHRSFFMAVPFVILVSFGLNKILILLKTKRVITAVFITFSSLLLFLECIYFLHNYSNHTASYKSIFTDNGNKEIIQYLLQNKNKYKNIYSTRGSDLSMYYLFYKNDFSDKYIKKDQKTPVDLLNSHIDNIFFIDDNCPSQKIEQSKVISNVLIIDGSDCRKAKGFKEELVLTRKDGTNAFRVLSAL